MRRRGTGRVLIRSNWHRRRALLRTPGMVWRWYTDRLRLMCAAQPNAGHIALGELEEISPRFTLITQNVDDLHERAGSSNVVHLHGKLAEFCCNLCRAAYKLKTDDLSRRSPPLCDLCSGPVRPAVVWFGEQLPQHETQRAWDAVERCDLMIVAGTSGIVYPAALLPELARAEGAIVIDINVERGLSSTLADYFLEGPSEHILPLLVNQAGSLR